MKLVFNTRKQYLAEDVEVLRWRRPKLKPAP